MQNPKVEIKIPPCQYESVSGVFLKCTHENHLEQPLYKPFHHA